MRALRSLIVVPAVLVCLLAVGSLVVPGATHAEEPAEGGGAAAVTVVLFWGNGCPHCATEKTFLDGLVVRHPEVVVEAYEVWYDEANRDRFIQVAAAHGIEPEGVPTTFLGKRHWVGFNDEIGAEIEAAVAAELAARSPEPSGSPPATVSPAPSPSMIEVPILGPVDPAAASLLAVTGLIGLVDGFNPCSLWVLSILLAMMLHSGSRRRLVAVGVTFLLVAGGAYGLFMLGLFAALEWVGYAAWVRIGIAAAVGILGVLAIRDYLSPARSFTIGIPEERKPGIVRRSRELALSGRSLMVVVPMTGLLAAGVSLLELPCTAGFPVMWNGILAERGVVGLEFAGLLALYLGVYLLDELLLFGAAAVTMRVTKMQERHGRALKLIAGSVMVALAAVMLVAPGLLETLGGAVGVFGLAIGAAVLALRFTPRLRPATTPPASTAHSRTRRSRARRRVLGTEG